MFFIIHVEIQKSYIIPRIIKYLFFISEVQCDHPPSIKDGFIEVANFKDNYIYGSKATYHCNPGFILWGMSF